MRKAIYVMLALALFVASNSFAARRRTADESSVPATGMEGKVGIGFDSISTGVPTGGFATPNALSVRYWASDILAWEGLLALGFNNTSSNGSSAGSNTFGIGVGAKYNWKKLDDVLIQFLGRATFANAANSTGTTTVGTTTFAIMAGTGFEAFIPAWRAISVEGNVNIGIISSTQNTSPSVTNTFFGINGNGFTPINVAVHYYF